MALKGFKVLDFTAFQNGPVATTMLSDLGADVVVGRSPRGGGGGCQEVQKQLLNMSRT